MERAPDPAGGPVAAGRPSIAARPWPLRQAAVALLAALAVMPAAAQTLQGDVVTPLSPTQLGPTVPMPPEAPARPQLSVPYDGAIAAYRAGRADEALQLAERALRDDPRNPQLRFLRGVILAERRRDDEAVAVFRGLVDDFPELAEPYNNLAVIHARRGDWDAARQTLEQAIRAVPSYPLAHENLGDVYLQLAARAYEQAGRLDARNAAARNKLALSRELIGRLTVPAPESRTPRSGASSEATPR